MFEWYLIGGMALVTFATRYGLFAAASTLILPPRWERALTFVPAAVLSALIAPMALVTPGEGIDISPVNARAVAALVAFLIAWRSGNLLYTVVGGLACFWGWQMVYP